MQTYYGPGLIAAILWLTAGHAEAADLRFVQPWIREAPPGMQVLAGYVEIANHGQQDRRITAAHSPDFARIEFHRTIIDGDMARMVAQETVALPAGQTVWFEPGGSHLMLFEPRRRLRTGDRVTLEFRFANGDRIAVSATVE